MFDHTHDGDPLPEAVFQRLVLEHFKSQDDRMASMEKAVQGGRRVEREFYTTREFAKLVGRSEYTIREWCRYGQIRAEKRATGRGPEMTWKIPASEVQRVLDEGPDPKNPITRWQ